jgi:hypothetical protein
MAQEINMGRTEMHTKYLLENIKRTDHLGELNIYGRITLKHILTLYSFSKCNRM